MKYSKSLARIAMVASLLTPLYSLASAQDSGIEIGAKAPAAALVTLDGKAADLSSHIGKTPVLMEFWATWCPNCKELEPAMASLHRKYGASVAFVNVAVSVNQSPALVNRYVAAHKLPGIQYFDAKGNATGAYDVPATSYVVLVDGTGKVVYTGLGGKQGEAIETAIKKVLK
ncbi:MAG TPA: TlpA disulfide reductase family protein [Gemmatimonadaceae bacterium]|nr:TlpA disulfide reductase family protein [Gemmatimonadaceae bacterium]